MQAHRSDAQLQGASAAERPLAMANRGADAWASEGVASGSNEPLVYIQQACTETAAQVRFALNPTSPLGREWFREIPFPTPFFPFGEGFTPPPTPCPWA